MSVLPASTPSLAELAQALSFGRLRDSLPLAESTGFDTLNAALPWGGWPLGALTEIMPHHAGIGEIRLVLPALQAFTRAERFVACIAPPELLYPPALVQHGIDLQRFIVIRPPTPSLAMWAAEQCLRCQSFGAVLAWPENNLGDKALRRLQLAAETGKNLAILYRPSAAAQLSSPAALRLCVESQDDALAIEIKKCRGGRAGKLVLCKVGSDDTPRLRATQAA